MKSRIITKSIIWGLAASLAMSIFYLVIMFLTMTPGEIWFNFRKYWYLISGIIIGFGIQIGLWLYIKNYSLHQPSSALPGASGAMSGTSMVACCAHHLADVLPILGISGLAIFLTKYQRPFLILGLSINIFGIAYMFYILEKHKSRILNNNLKNIDSL